MCYTQYLDRHDGTNPILRGCISSRTPLLCENRRPAVMNANWPVLVCCSTNMCNQDAVPTTPVLKPTEKIQEANKTESVPLITKNNTKTNEKNANNPITSDPTETSSVAFFNPMYIAIIMVSAISLLAVIIVIYLFCRKGRPFHPDCTVVQRNSYLKGHHQVTREDSELPLPLPRSNGIYDNKMAVNT
ncbi:uncharacterized protein LOC111613353 [Centruroides sculpturatus]|uniref:uncharacterized protein LOC111613353 n=1 Tax=Centruroides sculpturatus TaxID=218467 RepID=UPI000C6EFD25|nr:uncharacterized protein LOC111613353 [Centruroides sculpturatus]